MRLGGGGKWRWVLVEMRVRSPSRSRTGNEHVESMFYTLMARSRSVLRNAGWGGQLILPGIVADDERADAEVCDEWVGAIDADEYQHHLKVRDGCLVFSVQLC